MKQYLFTLLSALFVLTYFACDSTSPTTSGANEKFIGTWVFDSTISQAGVTASFYLVLRLNRDNTYEQTISATMPMLDISGTDKGKWVSIDDSIQLSPQKCTIVNPFTNVEEDNECQAPFRLPANIEGNEWRFEFTDPSTNQSFDAKMIRE